MNNLPYELIIEIFEKIDLKDTKIFIKFSKINKQFYFVYKKYFEDRVKKYFETKENYVPLQFWFNRNQRLALPLISLQYHQVNINIELFNFNESNEGNEVERKTNKKRNKETKKKKSFIKGKKNIPKSNKFYNLRR